VRTGHTRPLRSVQTRVRLARRAAHLSELGVGLRQLLCGRIALRDAAGANLEVLRNDEGPARSAYEQTSAGRRTQSEPAHPFSSSVTPSALRMMAICCILAKLSATRCRRSRTISLSCCTLSSRLTLAERTQRQLVTAATAAAIRTDVANPLGALGEFER
jgi:hypothetical protein